MVWKPHTAIEGEGSCQVAHSAAGSHDSLLEVTKGASCSVQAWLVRNAVRLQKEALLFTDERSKLEGELLNGIDVVKCNSWEVCMHTPTLAQILRSCVPETCGMFASAGSRSESQFPVGTTQWLPSGRPT